MMARLFRMISCKTCSHYANQGGFLQEKLRFDVRLPLWKPKEEQALISWVVIPR